MKDKNQLIKLGVSGIDPLSDFTSNLFLIPTEIHGCKNKSKNKVELYKRLEQLVPNLFLFLQLEFKMKDMET